MNTKLRRHDNTASGVWKFKGQDITPEVLEEVVAEMQNDTSNGTYSGLHVRSCSDGTLGVGFILERVVQFDNYVYQMTDGFKRRFGNQFIGYDVSKVTWLPDTES